ncbi:MAG: hypothetical protein RLZZ227_1613 [Pseudomonadota bacterium]
MNFARRQLLQYAGAAGFLSVAPELAQGGDNLHAFEVQDLVASPRFALGDVLLVDVAVRRFTTAGIYLYPAWGRPRPYEVRPRGNMLEFRNPASGLLLWTQSAQLDSVFAGLVLDKSIVLPAGSCPALCVPSLPA